MKYTLSIFSATAIVLLAVALDPITIGILLKLFFGAVGAATVAGAVIYVARLGMDLLKSWFRSRDTLSPSQNHLIGTVISNGIKEGKFELVQGVFNTQTKTMVESRTIRADALDADVASKHPYRTVIQYSYYDY